jgi:hypothetical protein
MLAALTLLQTSCVRAWIEVADEVRRSGWSRRRSSARPPCRCERVVRRQQLEAHDNDGDVGVASRRHLIDPGVECGPVFAGRHHRGVRVIQRLGCGTGLRGTGDGAVLGMSLFRNRKPHFLLWRRPNPNSAHIRPVSTNHRGQALRLHGLDRNFGNIGGNRGELRNVGFGLSSRNWGSLPPGSGRHEAVHGAPAAVWQGGGGTLMIQVGLG